MVALIQLTCAGNPVDDYFIQLKKNSIWNAARRFKGAKKNRLVTINIPEVKNSQFKVDENGKARLILRLTFNYGCRKTEVVHKYYRLRLIIKDQIGFAVLQVLNGKTCFFKGVVLTRSTAR